jgi:hypothetical protein
MVGAGVGFRILPTDVAKLPRVNPNIVVAHKPYHPKAMDERIEETQVYSETEDGKRSVYIIVGDSKQGWVSALGHYLEYIQDQNVESIMINYDSVRPKGEVLKTFGGRASGHTSLRQLFRLAHEVVRRVDRKTKRLTTVDVPYHS